MNTPQTAEQPKTSPDRSVPPHLVLVDLRLSAARDLLARVMGQVELRRAMSRPEPYVAAFHAFNGALRVVMSAETAVQLGGFVNHVKALEFVPRVTRVLAPRDWAVITFTLSNTGAGLPAGNA